MSDTIERNSPLSEFAVDDVCRAQFLDTMILELPYLGHFNLRMQPHDEAFSSRFHEKFGFEPTMEANTFCVHTDTLFAWLGPDERLLIVPEYQLDKTRSNIREVTAEGFATCANLSSAQTIIRVSGQRAVDFLSRSVVYDLHPRNFNPLQLVQTVAARVPVTLLNQTNEDEPVFDIVVRRSFSDYLWRWLVDVGSEYEFQLR